MTATYITNITVGSPGTDVAPAEDVLTETDRACVTPQTWNYANGSFTLLRKAERCYRECAPLQACLYAWGAAEDISKAVAENWKHYGVSHGNERDLWALMHGLLVFDSKLMQAAASICEADITNAEKNQAIDSLISAQTQQDLETQLDTCFYAAERLRECFYDGYTDELRLERDLKQVANYINRMLYWLRQPHPPVGFRQYQWQEPFVRPDEIANGTAAQNSKEAVAATHTIYWVYENYPNNKVVVHRSKCSYCNDGRGMRGTGNTKNGVWHGPYTDSCSARSKAASTHRADIRSCSICRP